MFKTHILKYDTEILLQIGVLVCEPLSEQKLNQLAFRRNGRSFTYSPVFFGPSLMEN